MQLQSISAFLFTVSNNLDTLTLINKSMRIQADSIYYAAIANLDGKKVVVNIGTTDKLNNEKQNDSLFSKSISYVPLYAASGEVRMALPDLLSLMLNLGVDMKQLEAAFSSAETRMSLINLQLESVKEPENSFAEIEALISQVIGASISASNSDYNDFMIRRPQAISAGRVKTPVIMMIRSSEAIEDLLSKNFFESDEDDSPCGQCAGCKSFEDEEPSLEELLGFEIPDINKIFEDVFSNIKPTQDVHEGMSLTEFFKTLMRDPDDVAPKESAKIKVKMTDSSHENNLPINWDGKLSNHMGSVKYQRKENDIGSGVRMVKAMIGGAKHLYPVNEVTGEPVLPGMDLNLYSVKNC